MDDLEQEGQRLFAPILLEAGAALFDCQSFEHGLKYMLFLMARRGVAGLELDLCEEILDGEAKRTAGQLIRMFKEHATLSPGFEEDLVAALAARNKLVHSYLADNITRMASATERQAMVLEIRALRATVQRSQKQLAPLNRFFATVLDEVDLGDLSNEARARSSRKHD